MAECAHLKLKRLLIYATIFAVTAISTVLLNNLLLSFAPSKSKESRRLHSPKLFDDDDQVQNETIWKELPRPELYGDSIYIYSAFRRNNETICIALLKTSSNHDNIFCSYENDREQKPAKIKLIHYSMGREYTAAFIKCPNLPSASKVQFHYKTSNISVGSPPLNIIDSDIQPTTTPPTFVMCVKPFFNIEDTNLLAQFLAYYRMQGVDKFVIYMYTASKGVLDFFDRHKSFVQLLPWPSPKEQLFDTQDVDKHISANGQFASTQDCLFRHQHSYSVYVDVDEYLVPKKAATLLDLIEEEKKKDPKTVGLVIPNVFFCKQLDSGSKIFPYILNSTYRQNFTWPCPSQSKPIVILPQYIREMSVHLIHEVSFGHSKYVDEDVAESFHYRLCFGPHWNFYNFKIPEVIREDLTMLKYKEALIQELKLISSDLFHN